MWNSGLLLVHAVKAPPWVFAVIVVVATVTIFGVFIFAALADGPKHKGKETGSASVSTPETYANKD